MAESNDVPEAPAEPVQIPDEQLQVVAGGSTPGGSTAFVLAPAPGDLRGPDGQIVDLGSVRL